MSLKEPIAAFVIFAFSLGAFLMAGQFGGGAGMFPRIIAGIMILCSVILFARSLIWPEPQQGEKMSFDEVKRTTISVFLTLAYVALIEPLGFVTSSVLYIPIAAYVLGLREHKAIWIGTLGFVGVVYFSFTKLFHTPLPPEAILRFLSH